MAKRNLYLSTVPVDEALSKYLSAFDGLLSPKFEEIPVEESLDRVTSQAVLARLSSPPFNAAAMDGIAVIASQTNGARESTPLTLIEGKDFITVDTGDPIHAPYDAVIMAEDLILSDVGYQIRESYSPWQHVRPVGEDIVVGEMIIPSRHRIRPIDIGVLFSGGITCVNVFSKPKVAIIPTGDEIIDAAKIDKCESPKEGEIIESNTRMFEARVKQLGADAVRLDPVCDNFEKLKEIILNCSSDFDMVIINAGSSAGTQDFTAEVLKKIGEVIVHGVAMKPGKPTVLAKVNDKPVIGTPGYPVSAYLAFETFAAPVLCVLTGRKNSAALETQAVISKRIVSSLKHREYVRIKAGRVNGKLIASPLARGAGAAMSLVRSDGFCVIERLCEGIDAGQAASVQLYRSIEEIDRALVAVGSHDLILDVIADLMSLSGEASLASAHVGSMAGLNALKRGECHIAPIHLLDEETGVYNSSWVKKILPNSDVRLIKGLGRVQGIIVQNNNPLKIKSIYDICRCRFINRQRGAGTRLFLDFLLKKEGIDVGSINGYSREAATHMAVAAAVQSGNADAGLGIAAAATALGLDFIPLGEEEYDFAVLADYLELDKTQIFIDILKSKKFHERLAKFANPFSGYTWGRAGAIVD